MNAVARSSPPIVGTAGELESLASIHPLRAGTVICATDFSAEAKAAANVAATIARCRSARLLLINAVGRAGESVMGDATQALEAETQRLAETGVEAQPLAFADGDPVESLLRHLRTERPAIVVLSSGSKKLLDRLVFGSFSEKIAQSSPVPTLVVRDSSVFASWDWTRRRLKVLLALDLCATSDPVLRWAKEFRVTGPCDFVACHINRLSSSTDAEVDASGAPANSPGLQIRLCRDLQKKVRDQIGEDECEVVVRPCLRKPGKCIAQIAAEVGAHVVAVGSHQRHGLGRVGHASVSRELLREAGLNVVCVPVTAEFDPHEAHIPDFRRVLVATDFSADGDAAVPFGCSACVAGGVIKLVHVAKPGGHSLREAESGGSIDLRHRLQSLVPAEARGRRCSFEFEILKRRNPAEAICDEADRFGADLVCLASHGWGASRALHGALTKAVLKKIHRPLLVVRRPDE